MESVSANMKRIVVCIALRQIYHWSKNWHPLKRMGIPSHQSGHIFRTMVKTFSKNVRTVFMIEGKVFNYCLLFLHLI